MFKSTLRLKSEEIDRRMNEKSQEFLDEEFKIGLKYWHKSPCLLYLVRIRKLTLTLVWKFRNSLLPEYVLLTNLIMDFLSILN